MVSELIILVCWLMFFSQLIHIFLKKYWNKKVYLVIDDE